MLSTASLRFFPFNSHIFEHAQQPELAPVQGGLNPSQTAMPINGAESK